MLLKKRLETEATKNGVKWDVIEQDYVLSWILQGISSVPQLNDSIVFKGGTALKKSYFGDYRFSQDLDFSVLDTKTLNGKLEELMNLACQQATQEIQDLGESAEFKSEPYMEKRPHPEGQKAYVIHSRLPWHRTFYTTVYAEFTFAEKVILPPVTRGIIHPYGETLIGQMNVYPLEEIVAEKIRALLQFAKKLHERGWGRSRVRDYYDLWRILKDYHGNLDTAIIPGLVEAKCSHKNVLFNSYEDIFQEKLKENLDKEWSPWLSNIVHNLPEKNIVIDDLKVLLDEVFAKK